MVLFNTSHPYPFWALFVRSSSFLLQRIHLLNCKSVSAEASDISTLFAQTLSGGKRDRKTAVPDLGIRLTSDLCPFLFCLAFRVHIKRSVPLQFCMQVSRNALEYVDARCHKLLQQTCEELRRTRPRINEIRNEIVQIFLFFTSYVRTCLTHSLGSISLSLSPPRQPLLCVSLHFA